MSTKTKKILVSKNQDRIDSVMDDINHTKVLIEKLLLHYEEKGIDVTDDEINALIRGNFSSNTIDRLAKERTAKLPEREKRTAIQNFIEEVNNYTGVFHVHLMYLNSNVYVSNGRVLIDETIEQTLNDTNSYYISDPKSIELYNRHEELVNQINQLRSELQERNTDPINSAYLVHYDARGEAYRPQGIYYGE